MHFSLESSDRNGSKLHQSFGMNSRYHYFTEKVIKHRIPRKAVYTSTLPAFKRHLDNVLNTMH